MVRELELAVAFQGESKSGKKVKYAGRAKSGEVIVFYAAEPILEPLRVTLLPLEYLIRNRDRKNRK